MSPLPYPNLLFSRQQLQQMSGVPDDVLGFWLKEGLIVPVASADRKHRRFEFDELHFASVLFAMRSLGANISILRVFSELMHRGKLLASQSPLSREGLGMAATLARRLIAFRSGREMLIRNPDYDRAKSWDENTVDLLMPATFEDQIVAEMLSITAKGDRSMVNSIAADLQLSDCTAIEMYNEITMDLGLWKQGHHQINWDWLAWIDEHGVPCCVGGEDSNFAFGWSGSEIRPEKAAFFIRISNCIRSVWADFDVGGASQ